MRGGYFLEFECIKNYLLVAIAKCASISALANSPVNYPVINLIIIAKDMMSHCHQMSCSYWFLR